MNAIKNFRDLDAWRVSMDLTILAYTAARQLPASERFELSAQMRRAAVSVPSNVAEGQATGHNRRYLWHVRIALGSLGELITLVELAKRLEFVAPDSTGELEREMERAGQLLHGLARSIRRKQLAVAATSLCLFGALGLAYVWGPILAERFLGGSWHDVLTLPLATLHFVLSWIHIDVLAHLLTSIAS